MWGLTTVFPHFIFYMTLTRKYFMVYDYVVTECNDGRVTIVTEGKVVAETRERALMKVAIIIGEDLIDDVTVLVRPF